MRIMIDVIKTADNLLVEIKKDRWGKSETKWSEMEKGLKMNLNRWLNLPNWLDGVPLKRSKARDNRSFLAVESVNNKLTARPVKPVVLPANDSPEAMEVADNLQEYFLSKWRSLRVKKNMKRFNRSVFFAKIGVIKVFWDADIDDFGLKAMDPRKVRFGVYANGETESEYAIELVNDKTLLQLIDMFPAKKEKILEKAGITEENAFKTNPMAEWYEMWIGNGLVTVYKDMVLDKKLNPYWDWTGLKMTKKEAGKLEGLNGRKREALMSRIKIDQAARTRTEKKVNEKGEEVETPVPYADKKGREVTLEQYFYNYFDQPRKPYIFGTVLDVEDGPIGATSLLEEVSPLQEEVDKRKRQISDNADYVNGITKVDTKLTEITLTDARKIHYDPHGLVYGPGVIPGVTRETGQSLPQMVFEDLAHSIGEIDNIFGTNDTFRGAGQKSETATGRAILREESYSRLDEMIDLMDYVGEELYGWWMQFIQTRYTEAHLAKRIGQDKASRTISIMQDHLQPGIEARVIPGQVLPEDRLYKAERAAEDAKNGFIDPLTYLEMAGGYDNPKEVMKRLIMFKQNPLTIVDLDDKDIEKIVRANQLMAQIAPQPAVADEGAGGGGTDQKAKAIAGFRMGIMEITQSPEFQSLEPEEQQQKLAEIRDQMGALAGAT